MERSGAIQPDGNQNPDPRSRGENRGLEYGKAESGREGGKRCTHCLKKRTYNRTETVIQNPDLGVRMGGLEHEKASSGGEWKEACPMWKEADLQPNGLEARTRVWNMRKLKPIRGEKMASGELKV